MPIGRSLAAFLVTRPVGHLDTLVEQPRELTGVVGVERRRAVGEFVRRNQIDAANFGNGMALYRKNSSQSTLEILA